MLKSCRIFLEIVAKSKKMCYTIHGATVLREAGQGRNPAALSDVNCVLFSIALNESSLKGADES